MVNTYKLFKTVIGLLCFMATILLFTVFKPYAPFAIFPGMYCVWYFTSEMEDIARDTHV